MFFKHSNACLWWLQKNLVWQWEKHSAHVGRSGGGSQVHQEEWIKQKANEYEGFDLAEWDVICHTQTVFIREQQNVSRIFFFKQDKRWNSPQTHSAPWVVTKLITWLLVQTGSFLWTPSHFSTCPLHTKKDHIPSHWISHPKGFQKEWRVINYWKQFS